MTSPVQKVFYDANVYDVIELMKQKNVRRICVVEGSGNAVGLLSAGDIFELLTHEMEELSKATGPHLKLMRFQPQYEMRMTS